MSFANKVVRWGRFHQKAVKQRRNFQLSSGSLVNFTTALPHEIYKMLLAEENQLEALRAKCNVD